MLCSEDILEGRTVWKHSLEEKAFKIIFKSTLSKEIGLQFFNSVLSRSFFSINLMTA